MTRRECKMIAEELAKALRTEFQRIVNEVVIEENEKYLSAKEACEMLGWSMNTLYHRIKDVPHVKVGKHLRFTERSLNQFILRK